MPMQNTTNLATNLKKLRVEKNLSLNDLAKLSGLTPQSIQQMETGITKNPALDKVIKLATAFAVSIDELIK